MPVGPNYSKTSSNSGGRPRGLFYAKVTNVVGTDVYVEVPRLTLDFEHGPIPYSGDVPTVGDEVYVGFLEGSQDDVVGIFPGGGGGGGPIEPTFFVCADSERQELQEVADYVSVSTANQTVHDACLALPAGGGKVQLSAGRFKVSKPTAGATAELITIYDDCTLEGVGDGTILEFETNYIPWEYGVYMLQNAQLKNLRIDLSNYGQENLFAVWADDFDCRIENVSFIGMDQNWKDEVFYVVGDYGTKIVNCRFYDIGGPNL